jgi:ribokinase
MSGSLLSFGSINADFQFRVPEHSAGAETVAAHNLHRLGGGKAANVALLARRLGCDAQLFGRVGGDDLAEQALIPLRDAGVDISAVRRAQADSTGVAMIAVPPGGKKHIVSAGEANFGFDDEDIDAVVRGIAASHGGSVLAVDYEVSPAAASRAVAAARGRGLRIVIDPSFPDSVPRADLHLASALTPNEGEALALVGLAPGGREAIEAAARALAQFGPSLVCIKLDDGGCLLLHEGIAWHQHAARIEAVDTTGAGDAFTGALAVALLEDQPWRQAVAFAVAASELAVMAFGAQPGYGSRAKLDAHLKSASRALTRWRP